MGPHTAFELRSDSLGALSSMAKKSSKAVEINKIMAEIALLEAETGVSVIQLTDIPGLSIDGPDALSRLSAPEAKQIPAQLCDVARAQCPLRDRSFWRSMLPPRKRRRFGLETH